MKVVLDEVLEVQCIYIQGWSLYIKMDERLMMCTVQGSI